MKPIQLPLGVRLRDDATFANYYPGANAAALGYVERLCQPDAGWGDSLIYLWGSAGVGRSHLLHRFGRRAARARQGSTCRTQAGANAQAAKKITVQQFAKETLL